MKRTFIKNATIINEDKSFIGCLLIEDNLIADIFEGTHADIHCDEIIDAQDCLLLPGIIDTHVHFRDPGLTHKADLESESLAAAAGGVTSYFDMPNTIPQTTTIEALEDKYRQASIKSHINYSFYFGATNTNYILFPELDIKQICGIKLFMGASTGNMLVDKTEALTEIFSKAPMIITAHCEDTTLINENIKRYKKIYGDDPSIIYHPLIRNEEACVKSSSCAIRLARKTGARLHIAHISTKKETTLLDSAPLLKKQITAEVCISHLYFTNQNYLTFGTRIKCNPSIKSVTDRDALRQAVNDGKIDTIATDHAPHLLREKEGGCLKAASGMPMVQFSLITMLELSDEGIFTKETIVKKMCHAPAELFQIEKRGFLRKGYKADLVLVNRLKRTWILTNKEIVSKCKWSPMEGHAYHWRVQRTFVNGQTIYNAKIDNPFNDKILGERLTFNR